MRNLPRRGFPALIRSDRGFSSSSKALLQTRLVSRLESFVPSSRTARLSFFIRPCILRSPYAAALLVRWEASLSNASCSISKPSSCIQDRLNAARRATEEFSQYRRSLSCANCFMAASSFSLPEGCLFSSFITPPLTHKCIGKAQSISLESLFSTLGAVSVFDLTASMPAGQLSWIEGSLPCGQTSLRSHFLPFNHPHHIQFSQFKPAYYPVRSSSAPISNSTRRNIHFKRIVSLELILPKKKIIDNQGSITKVFARCRRD